MFQDNEITLRATTREDMHRQWEFENDPELWFFDGGCPSPTKLETMFEHYEKSVSQRDERAISFAIEVNGSYVGHCGLEDFDPIHRHCSLRVEIGDEAQRGKGYGRRVVRLLLTFAFRHWNVQRVWLFTHAENERAIRCYLASGFIKEGRLRNHLWLDGRYVDRVHMGILRTEFESSAP